MTAQHDPIPLCVPHIQGNESRYVQDCISAEWISSVGSYVDAFETKTAQYVGRKYAVATVNGTAALHVALIAAGVQAGDEVITSSMSFIAPANAIRYAGAFPVFVDCEPRYLQMDVDLLKNFLETQCRTESGKLYNRKTGRRIAALLPVHVLGHPLDIAPIVSLAEKFEIPLIEDACEGFGASYQGKKVGSFGHLACLSFNGNKLISTGGGGMVLTDDGAIAQRVRYLTTQAKDDAVEFIHGEIGFNYRLSNVLAALGVGQLEALPQYIQKKKKIAATYEAAFQKIGISSVRQAPECDSTFWMYTLTSMPAHAKSSRELLKRLKAVGIETRPVWQPLHQSPAHKGAQVVGGAVSERINQTALSIPCSVGLTDAQQAKVIEHVLEFFATPRMSAKPLAAEI